MRDAVGELREVAGEVRVPGVRVHEVGALDAARHGEVDRHRRAAPRASGAVPASASHARTCPTTPLAVARPPKQWTSSVHEPRQLAREVLDVHAGAAVDVGRELPRQQRDPHGVGDHLDALADDDDAVLGDGEAGARSCSGSTPMCAPVDTRRSCRGWRCGRPRRADPPVEQHRAFDLGAAPRARRARGPSAARSRRRRSPRADQRVERLPAPPVLVEDELGRRQRRRARCGSATRGCRG